VLVRASDRPLPRLGVGSSVPAQPWLLLAVTRCLHLDLPAGFRRRPTAFLFAGLLPWLFLSGRARRLVTMVDNGPLLAK